MKVIVRVFNHGREQEAEIQSSENLPEHRERRPERVSEGNDNLHRSPLLKGFCTNSAPL
jgi:hypothetical protein